MDEYKYSFHVCHHLDQWVELVLSPERIELHNNAAITMLTVVANFMAFAAQAKVMPEATTAPFILYAHIYETLRGGSSMMPRIISAGDLFASTDAGEVVVVSSSCPKRDDVIEAMQNTCLDSPESVFAALGVGHLPMPYSSDDFL